MRTLACRSGPIGDLGANRPTSPRESACRSSPTVAPPRTSQQWLMRLGRFARKRRSPMGKHANFQASGPAPTWYRHAPISKVDPAMPIPSVSTYRLDTVAAKGRHPASAGADPPHRISVVVPVYRSRHTIGGLVAEQHQFTCLTPMPDGCRLPRTRDHPRARRRSRPVRHRRLPDTALAQRAEMVYSKGQGLPQHHAPAPALPDGGTSTASGVRLRYSPLNRVKENDRSI